MKVARACAPASARLSIQAMRLNRQRHCYFGAFVQTKAASVLSLAVLI